MPKPAVDSRTYLLNTCFCKHWGSVVISFDKVFKDGITVHPASINSQKIHGYRAPRKWNNSEFRWEVTPSDIFWFHTSGETFQVVGQMSAFEAPDSLPLVVYDDSLADNVLRKVLSEMLEDNVAFNAFLLQGKQSLKMVANLATGIANGTDRFMVRRFRSPKAFKRFLLKAGDDAIRDFSGKYLEYLYGWKPIADDVENAFSSMIDGYTGPEQLKFRMSVRKSMKRVSSVDVTRQAYLYFTPNFEWTQTLSRDQRAKIVLHYNFPSQAGDMLPKMTPFGTAWELTPWSFVVDWFLPVGDWIGAMEATQYAVYMTDAVLTQSVKVASRSGSRSRWTSTPWGPFPGWTPVYAAPPTISGFGFRMQREVLSSLDVLDRIRFPSFSSKFGLPQASQALALLSQVLKKWF